MGILTVYRMNDSLQDAEGIRNEATRRKDSAQRLKEEAAQLQTDASNAVSNLDNYKQQVNIEKNNANKVRIQTFELKIRARDSNSRFERLELMNGWF